jgi:hypothetical protein
LPCEFTLEHYFDTLDRYKKAGYHIIPIGRFGEHDGKHILLRHDVDLSLRWARHLAEQEHQHGISATYYILPSSPFYNILSKQGQEDIRSIYEYGHEIGLHIDTRYHQMGEFELLGNIIGHPVTNFSQHLLGVEIMPQLDPYLDGVMRNAMSHVQRRGYKYLSDSSVRWREGCFCQWIDKVDKLLILTHPCWWITSQQNKYLILNDLGFGIAHQLGDALKTYQDLMVKEDKKYEL